MGHMRANESHQLVPDRQSEQCQLQPQQDSFKSLPRDWDSITVSNELHCRPPGYLEGLRMGWVRDQKGIQLEDRPLVCFLARILCSDSSDSVERRFTMQITGSPEDIRAV